MRVIVILIILLLIAIFLKPSKFKKFFLVYALSIGIIGVLVYEGNRYVDTRTSTTITPLEVELEDFRMDTTLQLFLKGRIVNNASKGTIKEVNLRLTVHKEADQASAAVPEILGIQDFTVVSRIGPGEHKEIIQKVSVPGMDPERPPSWDLKVVSVKTALWD